MFYFLIFFVNKIFIIRFIYGLFSFIIKFGFDGVLFGGGIGVGVGIFLLLLFFGIFIVIMRRKMEGFNYEVL